MKRSENDQFRDLVVSLVAQIPTGRVMSYGQIAALCGSPMAARIVGGIAHWGDQGLPWQRVVHKDGSLAIGYPGGLDSHKQTLEQEGVVVRANHTVNMEEYQWHPNL